MDIANNTAMSHPVCAHQYKKKIKEKTPETKKKIFVVVIFSWFNFFGNLIN